MNKKIFLLFLLLALFLLPILSDASVSEDIKEQKRVIILFSDEVKPEVVKKYKGNFLYKFDFIKGLVAEIPAEEIENLKKEPGIKSIEEDYPIRILPVEVKPETPRMYNKEISANSEIVFSQSPSVSPNWNLRETGINAVEVWNLGATGSGIKIAILDTGVDYTAADLDKNYLGGYDFANNDTKPLDDNNHGTFVASVSVAEGQSRIVGGAYDAGYYAIKVLNRQGEGYTSWLIQGIEWAIKGKDGILGTGDEADIISMSLGGSDYSAALEEAVNNAFNQNILLVAASGNEGSNSSLYPAAYTNVISVGAHAEDQTIPAWSNGGVDVVAPGVSVIAMDSKANQLWYVSGTSIATPQVSATLALLKNLANLNNKQFSHTYYWATLKHSAKDLGYSVTKQGEGKTKADWAASLLNNDWFLTFNVEYYDYAYLNNNGYTVYYIGRTMKYRLNITNGWQKNVNLKIKTIQTYENGEVLPGESIQEWNVAILNGETFILDDSYYISLGTQPGIDKTRLTIEYDTMNPSAVIIDKAEAGTWCPPGEEQI